MPNPNWPVTLPQAVLMGFDEDIDLYVVRSKMDTGPDKVRRRATKIRRQWPVKLILTCAQVDTLDNFLLTSCEGGVLPFDWKNPRTGASTELRFVGGLRKKNLVPGYTTGRWEVGFTLETV